MGLLDDAIREHLELKRLRGADPGEVAREQREALDVTLAEQAPSDEDGRPAAADSDGAAAPSQKGDPDWNDDTATVASAAHGSEISDVGQETAELDMQTVLGEGDGKSPTDVPPPGSVDGHSADGHDDADSLEWEMPQQRAKGALEDAPDR